jgi:hypothetical protein
LSILSPTTEVSQVSTLREVRQRHEPALLALPNVVGVSDETVEGRDVILVLVSRKVPREQLAPGEVVPEELEGFPTDVVEIGAPTAPPSG